MRLPPWETNICIQPVVEVGGNGGEGRGRVMGRIYIGRGREREIRKEGRVRGREKWEVAGARTVNRTKTLLKSSFLLFCVSSYRSFVWFSKNYLRFCGVHTVIAEIKTD